MERVDDCTTFDAYIYIYTHVKVVCSDGKNLAQKWNWELVNYAEYSIETLDGGCGNTARILSQFFLEIKSQTWILEFINTSKDASERTLFAFVCWTRDVGSKQLFENDKTRLELERET